MGLISNVSGRCWLGILGLAAFFALGLPRTDAQDTMETVVLKDGKRIQAVKVDSKTDTIIVYTREDPLKTWIQDSKGQYVENLKQTTYHWDDLSEESLQRYLPKKWQELQKKQGEREKAELDQRKKEDVKKVVVSDKGANVQIQFFKGETEVIKDTSVSPPRDIKADTFLLQGKVRNISGKLLYNVSAGYKSVDLAKDTDLANVLAYEAWQEFKIRLPSAPDLRKSDVFLVIRCRGTPLAAPATNDNKDDKSWIAYIFKIQQRKSGEYILTPMN